MGAGIADQPIITYLGWRRARRLLLQARANASGAPASVVLFGPAGSGKSLLLRRLRSLLQTEGDTVWLATGAIPEAIGGASVLLLDDADRLDDAALTAQIATPACFVVLAGGLGFADRLAGLALTSATITLEPMLASEAQIYLASKLRQAGAADALPADQWQELICRSGGWPGPLRNLVQAARAGITSEADPQAEISTEPVVPEPHPALHAIDPNVADAPLAHAATDDGVAVWLATAARAHADTQAPRMRPSDRPLVVVGAIAASVLIGLGAILWRLNPGLRQTDTAPRADATTTPPPRPPRAPTPPALARVTLLPAVTVHAAPPRTTLALAGVAAEATPTPSTQPPDAIAVLPTGAPAVVELVYRRGDAGSQREAERLARLLAADHVALAPPVAVARGTRAGGIRYFFSEDRNSALAVQRALGTPTGPRLSAAVAPRPLPGMIEVVVPGPPRHAPGGKAGPLARDITRTP